MRKNIVEIMAQSICANGFPACDACVKAMQARIDKVDHIDADLIETTAIAIANTSGIYSENTLTPSRVMFAFRFLQDIIPYFLEKVREVEVRERIKSIQENGG